MATRGESVLAWCLLRVAAMEATGARKLMVDRSIRGRGIRDARVLSAMETVPREAFLPPELAEFAYDDRPLPIEAGQTISQPYIVALMTEALQLGSDEDVLEIGTGSGYAAAVLAAVARRVYTIERHRELADLARERLATLGYRNVEVLCGDGTLGWPEHAPFHAIIVAAGGPHLPPALLAQLARGGRLVMPVGESRAQDLVRVTRVTDTKYRREELGPVTFVPLIGAQGWADAVTRRRRRGVWPPRNPGPARAELPASRPALVSKLVAECAEPIAMLGDLLSRRVEYAAQDSDAFFDAAQNARVVASAESYYRAMYYGSAASWNLRDSHMFDTLRAILAHRGADAKLIVWRCCLCRGLASALTVNAIESATEKSAAKNIVSFFNTGTPSIKSGPAE